jgi:hypothetical protein
MHKSLIAIGMGIAIAVSACSKPPQDIAAADVGDQGYSRLSCAQLHTNQITISQNLDTLSAEQRDARSGDTVGVLLLGLPLSRMSGGDKETQIAVTKGKLNAVNSAISQKHC